MNECVLDSTPRLSSTNSTSQGLGREEEEERRVEVGQT